MAAPNPKFDSNSDVHFDVYDAGKIVVSGKLPANSLPIQKLKTLVHNESAKWSKTYITYAPVIAFRTDDYYIVMQRNTLILNYKNSDGNCVQVARDITQETYDTIRTALLEQKG